MKKHLLAATGLAVALAAPSFANEGFYVKGGLGFGAFSDLDIDRDFGATQDTAMVDSEIGLRYLLGGGYAFDNGVSLQLDFVDRDDVSGAIEDVNGPVDMDPGSIDATSLMLSLMYTFNRDGKWQPYAGVGAGYLETELAGEFKSSSIGTQLYSAEEEGLGVQGILGLGYEINDRWSAGVEYRHLYGEDLSFQDPTPASGTIDFDFQTDDYRSNEVFATLAYSFGQRTPAPAPAPEPVAPPPPPPPPPAPVAPVTPEVACENVPFVVYFEWDQSDLTDQAEDVIEAAVDQIQNCDLTMVEIEGHTDRSGAVGYNERLSQKRAQVVRDALIMDGVPASIIALSAKGETEPAVDTPDGIREPLNRRSEVVIKVR